jgi:hypothetical protein
MPNTTPRPCSLLNKPQRRKPRQIGVAATDDPSDGQFESCRTDPGRPGAAASPSASSRHYCEVPVPGLWTGRPAAAAALSRRWS